MNERAWLASEDSRPMLDHLAARVNPRERWRKVKLLACACCYRIYPKHADDVRFQLVEVSEREADGAATCDELRAAEVRAMDAGIRYSPVECLVSGDLYYAIRHAATAQSSPTPAGAQTDAETRRLQGEAFRSQAQLVREIFGNPFRAVAFDPAWRTTDVLLLARGIYDDRAFDRLPILADALQDAGCESDDILDHLRDATAPHVRGCWALDLVLGKE